MRDDANGLSDAAQIEALADQLCACADEIHKRVMKDLNAHNGGPISETEQTIARALLEDEILLRLRAGGLYADAATHTVKSLGHSQQQIVELTADADPLQIVAETFPAGTLSGAPKHNAMQLIDRYENLSRSFYSGSIGYMGFDGEFNHAIMIRTFMSKDNTLYYQAGAGVVAKSVVESELQEVHNKLAALRTAIEQAKTI